MSNAALAQTLIRAVDEADSAIRLVQAVQQLANARLAETVPTLIATLRYNNPGAAVAAVDGLIAIGKPAVQPLLDLLDGHNYTARAWAIRAMAGIGDARGLDVLMEAAQHDFALSVRRAAARGLGTVHWEELEVAQAQVAQVNACEVLMGLGQDPEWVVRYAAIAGLQSLAQATVDTQPALGSTILAHLQQLTDTDPDAGVRTRAVRAQQILQSLHILQGEDQRGFTAVEMDWRLTLEKLYYRKSQERRVTLLEGDPRRYQDLAMALMEAVRSL
jgi:phycocyanobilin lyase beta subunit